MTTLRLVRTCVCFLSLFAAAAWAASGDISVQFLASPETLSPPSPGHAFVCLRIDLATGVKEDCFGFYPQDAGSILNGPGKVEAELSRDNAPNRFSTVSTSYEHTVTDAQRRAVYTEIQTWAGADYSLLVSNCGDMVFAVARAVGLKTPPRDSVTRPVAFVDSLKALN